MKPQLCFFFLKNILTLVFKLHVLVSVSFRFLHIFLSFTAYTILVFKLKRCFPVLNISANH